jgi:hypothetical protein
MNTPGKEELLQIARAHYPRGDSTAPDDHRSPEHRAWEEAWDKAMKWKECDTLIEALQAAFPMARAARFVQPRKAACVYCILLLEKGDRTGGRHLTRIVGAVSILAPLYLIYVTRESIGSAQPSPRPLAIFSPEGPEKAPAEMLAHLIELHLGYRPFPLELAHVPIPDIHVDFLHSEQPTLLTALFANHLEDLP